MRERERKLDRLEQDLIRVPGVKSARVVGLDAPSEIHIVADLERSPKQVVRDVQSLASAGFGIPIDHRIVSVVQLSEEDQQIGQPPQVDGRRPLLEAVVVATKQDSGWVKVNLRWPSGEETEGAGMAAPSREARARGAADALVKALDPVLGSRNARVDIDQVVLHRIGASEAVLVRAQFAEAGTTTPLVGCALVYDDVATAAVHALLHALNRKLAQP